MHEDARRRRVLEIARIDRIERGEVRRLQHAVDIALHELAQRCAGHFEAMLHLREHARCLHVERRGQRISPVSGSSGGVPDRNAKPLMKMIGVIGGCRWRHIAQARSKRARRAGASARPLHHGVPAQYAADEAGCVGKGRSILLMPQGLPVMRNVSLLDALSADTPHACDGGRQRYVRLTSVCLNPNLTIAPLVKAQRLH